MKTIAEIGTSVQGQLNGELHLFGLNPLMSKMLGLTATLIAVFVLSYLCLVLTKWFTKHFLEKTGLKKRYSWVDAAINQHVFRRAAHLVPGFIIQATAPLMVIAALPMTLVLSKMLSVSSAVYVIVIGTATLFSLLNTVEVQYRHFSMAKTRPIKSYVQVAKIIISILTCVFVGSVILNRSPIYLLTGLGTMTAIIMLVFKDSILGFVSSIQIAANDMVRIGDWIEVPGYGADGDVIDISLNTVKVQNFDKTIVTIPSYALLNNGVKNWRGMSESGGRRIKRSIYVDVNSITFCNQQLVDKLNALPVLKDSLQARLAEINEFNNMLGVGEDNNAIVMHRLTNLGAFRLYLEAYLSKHPKIHRQLTFLVRQLQDEGRGVPLELYIFTNDTNWIRYEAIQADIFEHIYAIMSYFELRPFQNLSGQSFHFDMARQHTDVALPLQKQAVSVIGS